MKKIFVALFALSPFFGMAQLGYPSYDEVKAKISQLKSNKFVSVGTIGKSFGEEDIPIVKLQKDTKTKPTLLIVAGIDGKHPSGVVSTLELTNNLLAMQPDSLASLLDNRSIWIIPMVNPDAYKRNVKTNIWNSGNARTIDNDRDGRMDEDPPKDLNNDGVLSQMRVKSIAGTHHTHPNYPHVLVASDRSKGEKGSYVLFNEGIDADFDGQFGEDGVGGVNIDRNFTFDYPVFYPESGTYAASEPETKALMDLVYNNPQIGAVFQFGLANNLSTPEVFNSAKANERITSSWSANDVEVSKYVSSLYKESTKSLGEPTKLAHERGNFANTAYYHLGKFSFVSPGWWPAVSDSSKVTKPAVAEDVFYKWVDQNAVQGAILPWTSVVHPSFPNQEVEIGGVVDIYRNNPPIAFLNESSNAHTDFVQRLIQAMPELVFQQPVVTALGGDVYRVELAVTNVGMMPIYPEIADRIRHSAKFKAVCELQKGQEFLNGKRLQLYPSLSSGQSQTFSWLIKGKGTALIKAGCPTAGEVNIEVKL